ncbi:Sulfotransferase domain-containing protein [Cyclobacterium xiamenense]|uniref:Sulfotransferase domain-containing protein n=1 Tax=Cyclobacterium xiamenense TaxID=1297121 RepID=A0A1H6ZBG6_9BACT|nr:sulfotransferase domain-containing protein [Cyclobacterium xiamenense]SEJ50771.1 Sulfotransferase domain-containing protein [Cyclobacterium xiamenense]
MNLDKFSSVVRSAFYIFFVPNSFFIISYPKSGNTLVRRIIAQLVSGKDVTIGHKELNEVLPEIGRPFSRKSIISFGFKSHNIPPLVLWSRGIFIFRNPFDSLCSCYEYYNRNTNRHFDSIDDFLKSKYGLIWYTQHLDFFLKLISNDSWISKQWLILDYRILLEDRLTAINSIASYLGISPFDTDMILRHTSVASLAKLEEASGSKSHKGFTKVKNYDSYRNEIAPELYERILQLEKIYYQLFP